MVDKGVEELPKNASRLTQVEKADIFLRLHNEDKTYARAHENTRSTLTNIIAAAAALYSRRAAVSPPLLPTAVADRFARLAHSAPAAAFRASRCTLGSSQSYSCPNLGAS